MRIIIVRENARKHMAAMVVSVKGCHMAEVERLTVHPIFSRMNRRGAGWRMVIPASKADQQAALIKAELDALMADDAVAA